ncbi:MAG: translation initiation factor IF-2 [Candidatus Omnitrophica bacterium]|nr:translation initiation factor IF-2 [Candidatus Omnitrophota bacterium]
MSIRVHTLAKQLGITSKELLAKLKSLNIKAAGHMSALDDGTVQIVSAELKGKTKDSGAKVKSKAKPKAEPKAKPKVKPKAKPRPAPKAKPKVQAKPTIEEQPQVKEEPAQPTQETVGEEPKLKPLQTKMPLSVKELAVKLNVKTNDLIKHLMKMKIMATINQMLDEDTVVKIGKEFDYAIERLPDLEEELLHIQKEDDAEGDLQHRAPVVTLMGHVDHGKTSLLDMIRKTRVAAREAGGITQHIGAYEVNVGNKKITFLDTPGHEAFTAMRARGAVATDIVVLVVAANDGVMPQTIEAIDHAKAAGVPIVVAINKVDLPHINLAKVKAQLGQRGLNTEDMGGKTIAVNVSAKSGAGIDEMLEMILLEAEMLELKANPNRYARGVVIESKLSRGTGPTATVLVQNGTLKIGDVLVCGDFCAKVKSMINDQGKQIKQAGPSDPVEISGLTGVPEAGERFYVVEDEKKAREFSFRRLEEKRLRGASSAAHVSLEDLYQQIKDGKIKELNLIVKADVQGSLEALLQSLQKLTTEDVTIKIIHSGVGNINVSDVMLATVSNALVIGFHVGIQSNAKELAEKEKVDITLYNIIYEVTANIKSALEGMLEPHLKENFLGKAQVRQIFKVTKVGNVAGCIVLAGKIFRNAQGKVIRNNEEVFRGKITSLKRFKDDAKEVTAGQECGIGFERFKEIRPADIIECFEIEKVARRL